MRALDDGEVAVEPGDIAVFRDPDAGGHTHECPLIISREKALKTNWVNQVEGKMEVPA